MTSHLTGVARKLRREQTDAERLLWQRLRNRQVCGAKFRRQQPVGPYIVDFACAQYRLVVELDGSQHLDQAEGDGARDGWLQQRGYRVLRFWNSEVLANLNGVLERIGEAVEEGIRRSE